jgi:type I restriction enzyme R subunit
MSDLLSNSESESTGNQSSASFEMIAEHSHKKAYAGHSKQAKPISYQSEAQLERQFIKDLQGQGYQHLTLPNGAEAIEQALLNNLRTQLERLNSDKLDNQVFTDDQWFRIQRDHLFNPKDKIIDRARNLREPFSFRLTNVREVNLLLLSPDPNNNSYQVVNQVENDSGHQKNRYDVTVLINGLPLVHIELKRRGVSIEEAFKQINRYNRDSFWASSDKTRAGLYSWVQLFIASNGTKTRYWSNTVKELSRKNQLGQEVRRTKTPGFEFTSSWADKSNQNIHDLDQFARTFMDRRQLGRIIYDYCIVDIKDTMKVLRPYQVYAVEAAFEKANQKNPAIIGTVNAGGYVWHTTGSGKTLTSFILARILSRRQQGNSKVLFVVDRQDLDKQTKEEFNKLSPNSVDGNDNTAQLKMQLLDPNCQIIVTTIQKLAVLSKQSKRDKKLKQQLSAAAGDETVIIYDECHRSQFGEQHEAIKKLFPRHRIFGFTGTPIFAENAQRSKGIETSNGERVIATTEALFGSCLHSYTIVNAIDDKNVLRFKIDTQSVGDEDPMYYSHPERIASVVKHIVNNHNRVTHNRAFNSLFAVESVKAADLYFREFQAYNSQLIELREQAHANNDKTALATIPEPLRVSTVYTYSPNDQAEQSGDIYSIDDLDLDRADEMKKSDRDNLLNSITVYNTEYVTNFSLSDFKSYKDDISNKMKSHAERKSGDLPFQIDLLIVVNMFLTGFDAPTLNTLYVDKEMRMHSLIQAFSRTNRILNSQKSHGEVVCYRDLRSRVDEALSLFGQENAGKIVVLPSYDQCRKSIVDAISEVEKFGSPQDVLHLKRERDKSRFVKAWTKFMGQLNVISTFSAYSDEGIGQAKLPDRLVQDYSSVYHDLHEQYLEDQSRFEDPRDGSLEPVSFDINLLKSIEVNIDYILDLIGEMIDIENDPHAKQAVKDEIQSRIGASASLREKSDLINDFISDLTVQALPGGNVPSSSQNNVYQSFQRFVNQRAKESIKAVSDQYGLQVPETTEFMERCLHEKEFSATGQSIIKLQSGTVKLGFGSKRNQWKEQVERHLENIYNEMVNVLDTVD